MRILLFAIFFCIAQASEGFDYLNWYRIHSGASLVKEDRALQKMALAHARYLAINNKIGHQEQRGLAGFTGTTVFDRAVSARSPSRMVVENISYGERDFFASLDTLFAAIYHRLAFLRPFYDEVGIAKVRSGGRYKRIYVYTLANSRLQQLCRSATEPQSGYVYTNLCSDGRKIAKRTYDLAMKMVAQNAAPIIIWPSNGAVVDPAFYEEYPDPLPQCSVSGYPISVTFNPVYLGDVVLDRFELFEHGRRVAAKLLTYTTDPNRKIKPYEYALMPIKRLKFATKYDLLLRYRSGGSLKEIRWSFRTKKAPFTLQSVKKRMKLRSNHYYTFYYEPKDCKDVITSIWMRCRGTKSRYKMIDKNSFNAIFKGAGSCQLHINGKKYLLQISDSRK